MNGPSTAPFFTVYDDEGNVLVEGADLRQDAKYQDCRIRIAGFEVGFNTAEYTDADGTANREFRLQDDDGNIIGWTHVEFVHDATESRLGKFTIRLNIRGEGVTRPAALQNEVPLSLTGAGADLRSVFPQLDDSFYDQGYRIRTVTLDAEKPKTAEEKLLIPKWKGSGIYKKVKGLKVRCVFLIDPDGNLIACLNCLFFFEK